MQLVPNWCPIGNTLLPKPMMTQIYNDMQYHYARMSYHNGIELP